MLEIKDILCEKEPMPQNNQVYGSSYMEHHLKSLFTVVFADLTGIRIMATFLC